MFWFNFFASMWIVSGMWVYYTYPENPHMPEDEKTKFINSFFIIPPTLIISVLVLSVAALLEFVLWFFNIGGKSN